MVNSVVVEIDAKGHIEPVDVSQSLPPGRATLVFDMEPIDHSCYLLSEKALSDWLSPEEDKAWAYLQQDKS